MKVAVTGATGFIGRHLVKRLIKDNQTVVALCHRARASEDNVITVSGSVDDAGSLRAAFAGCQAVIHLVGIIAETRDKTFNKTVAEGTANAVKAAVQAGVKKFVYLSATGTSPDAASLYHQSKYRAEQSVKAGSLEYVIIRPSVVFGQGDGFISMLTRMIKLLPVTPVIGSGRYCLQPVYIDDLVAILSASLTNQGAIGRIIEVGGPEKLEFLQILNILKKHLGKKRMNIFLPTVLMSTVAGLLETVVKPAPLTRDQIRMMKVGSTCDNELMIKLFDIQPVTLEEGLKKY